ncbi:dopamine N-acetyltransferase-like [Zerene cesonia]|uniref:dopamine N-acetyltransferase-like n=1 Tax=Zerene cesonia TaxID=33412 RepID=UPI0018E512BC|nr:dopamine N-acetyltransferase-like [Zerene cesonia]XP_038212458.1 dopamine N-acetyltransferase-like [Zerene cesonia]
MGYFYIKRVTKSVIEGVIKFLKRTYFLDEPLIKSLQYCTSETEYCPELEEYCRNVLSELSVIVTDAEGNIIGALVNTIGLIHDPIDYLCNIEQCDNIKVQKFMRVIAGRSGANLQEKFPDDDKSFDIIIAATDKAWRNKGVMKKLMEEAQKIAQEHGIRLIRIDTSSFYSARAAENQGFTCIYERRYADIKMNGEPIVVPEPPHTMDKVFIKELLNVKNDVTNSEFSIVFGQNV